MTLETFIAAELASNGLRLADDGEDGAWLEMSSAGLVMATDGEIPVTEDLVSCARQWDTEAIHSRMSNKPRQVVTAQMLRDMWLNSDCGGPKRAAEALDGLPGPERNRLEVDLWLLLRRDHEGISLAELRIVVELALVWPVS